MQASAPSGPRFFLASDCRPGEGPLELAPGETEHATRVLRLGAGDALVGLDGRGTAWPLAIRALERRGSREPALVLELAGPAWREAEPGAPGSREPWIEAAVAWPRASLAEDLLGRLTQLGVSAIVPLHCRESGAAARAGSIGRIERLEQVLRAAVKQSRRVWLPELRAAVVPAELAARLAGDGRGRAALLEPGAAQSLLHWLGALPGPAREWGTRQRPLWLIVGPEGGFDAAERADLIGAGAAAAALVPHVLRIETAAALAVGLAAALASESALQPAAQALSRRGARSAEAPGSAPPDESTRAER
jgi:16S rRNA (uracil1498-N3)-methyltransferase